MPYRVSRFRTVAIPSLVSCTLAISACSGGQDGRDALTGHDAGLEPVIDASGSIPDASESTPDASESTPDASESIPDASESTPDASDPGFDCTNLDCDDGDVCTRDSCDVVAGCAHTTRSARVRFEPSTAAFTVAHGVATSQTFAAFDDDVDVSTCVTWALEGENIGSLSGSTFTPKASFGGTSVLSATLGTEKSTLPITLLATVIHNTGDLSDEQIEALDAPEPAADASASIVYPAHETVFPLDVLPPILQWNGAVALDTYRIRIRSQHFEATDYFSAALPARYEIPQAVWEMLGRSGKGAESDPVTVELRRAHAGSTYAVAPQTWHIAQGRLNSTVYYRELPDSCGAPNGRVAALPPEQGTLRTIAEDTGCHSCHSVSHDGRKFLSSYDVGSQFPFRLTDLSQEPMTTGPSGLGAGVWGTFSAFNPAGDKALIGADRANGQYSLNIVGIPNGNLLASDVLGTRCAEPAWSRDGARIAGICSLTNGSGWAFDASRGSLYVGSVGEDGFSVEPGTELGAGSDGQGRPSYPAFSADSKLIAYSRTTAGSRSTANGKLYLAAVDGSFNRELTRITSGDHEYYPSFAPRRAGGYHWLAFTSRRAYGNTPVAKPQIWIAAIKDETGEADPSRPAFYLRGQLACAKAFETKFENVVCRDEASTCTYGTECCSGTCLVTASDTQGTCATQPAAQCVVEGNRCAESSDCCEPEGFACIDQVCQQTTKR